MSSITVDVHAPGGKKAGTAELPGEIFDVQTNIPLIHQVVVAQLAAARQGTHSTVPVTVRGVPRSGPAVAPFTAPSRVTTPSAPRRR